MTMHCLSDDTDKYFHIVALLFSSSCIQKHSVFYCTCATQQRINTGVGRTTHATLTMQFTTILTTSRCQTIKLQYYF